MVGIKRIAVIAILGSGVFFNESFARNKKPNNREEQKKEKFVITDSQLRSDAHIKKKLQHSLSPDQFLDILEELAILRAHCKDQGSQLEIYKKLENTLKAEYDEKTKEIEQRLRKMIEDGEGSKAGPELIKKIKEEGVDVSSLRFRIQVGEVSTYTAAEKIKDQLRSIGQKTLIVCLYKGYVVPLDLVLSFLRKSEN